MRSHWRLLAGACMTALAAACADTNSAPEVTDRVGADADVSAGRYLQVGSSVAWNGTARKLIADRLVTAVHVQGRILTYLSLAQYNAVVAAEGEKGRHRRASPAAAAAGASVAVLSAFFPEDAAFLEATMDAQFPCDVQDGRKRRRTEDIAWGEEIGRAIGADVVAYAANDNYNLKIPPPAPIGPGYWTSSATPPAPSVRSLYGTRPFFLASEDQFRPAPPPAFGSPAFLADLAEIRAFSDTRTADLVALAQLWAPRGPAWQNEVAVELIKSRDRSERKAAHILALANMAGFDAQIGCFDAKFAYWLVRPTKADPGITLAIPLPNHPAYISGHSCITASYATVLAHFFPRARAGLDEDIEQAGLSRMVAGLHYRFDITAGQELGRNVAQWVIAHDVGRQEPFPLD